MLDKARYRIEASAIISSEAKDKLYVKRHDLTQRWPLDDASLDLAFGNLVLEHLESLDFFFSEAARTIRKDGKLLVCEYHPYKQFDVGLFFQCSASLK